MTRVPQSGVLPLTYVVPLTAEDRSAGDLTSYLSALSEVVEVIVVDACSPAAFGRHAELFGAAVRHVSPDPDLRPGDPAWEAAVTGLRLASNRTAVVAPADVRMSADDLRALTRGNGAPSGNGAARPARPSVAPSVAPRGGVLVGDRADLLGLLLGEQAAPGDAVRRPVDAARFEPAGHPHAARTATPG